MNVMKIGVLVALLAINALFVAAIAQDAGMMGGSSSGNVSKMMGTSTYGNMGVTQSRNIQCNIPSFDGKDWDPKAVNFVGKANQACVMQNKYSTICQQVCIKKVKTIVTVRGRNVSHKVRTGCINADPSVLQGLTSDKCYKAAKEACSAANPGNVYCGNQKCMKTALFNCKQNLFNAQNR